MPDELRRCQGCDGSTRTAQVAPQHEIQHKETVLVILEGVAKVDNERVVDLRVYEQRGSLELMRR